MVIIIIQTDYMALNRNYYYYAEIYQIDAL